MAANPTCYHRRPQRKLSGNIERVCLLLVANLNVQNSARFLGSSNAPRLYSYSRRAKCPLFVPFGRPLLVNVHLRHMYPDLLQSSYVKQLRSPPHSPSISRTSSSMCSTYGNHIAESIWHWSASFHTLPTATSTRRPSPHPSTPSTMIHDVLSVDEPSKLHSPRSSLIPVVPRQAATGPETPGCVCSPRILSIDHLRLLLPYWAFPFIPRPYTALVGKHAVGLLAATLLWRWLHRGEHHSDRESAPKYLYDTDDIPLTLTVI